MKNFRALLIWQKSMSLVTETYLSTKEFPKEEMEEDLVPKKKARTSRKRV